MAKFELYSGVSSRLSSMPSKDGAVYFTKDDGRLYIDKLYNGKIERFKVNDVQIVYNTTEGFVSDISTVAEKGTFYVYTDRINDDSFIKVGDGTSYLVDMPFVDSSGINKHAMNTDIHVTADEKAFWNNKVTCYLDSADPNTLVFDKN